MKKRSFLLFEVLLAFTLVALAAPFLLRLPLLQYKHQIRQIEECEYERIADLSYSEVKELLLKQSIPWKKLPEKTVTSKEYPLKEISLHIPHFPKKTLQRSFTLQCVREKKGKQGELFRLYKVTVILGNDKKKYHYRILVQLLAEPASEKT